MASTGRLMKPRRRETGGSSFSIAIMAKLRTEVRIGTPEGGFCIISLPAPGYNSRRRLPQPRFNEMNLDLAWISLAALLLVMFVSCTSTVNAGLLSIALAWVLAIYVSPLLEPRLGMKELVAGFPTDLCLTLIGVTLLFSQAHVNGTLDRLARYAVR